jgi:hypothetical protein
MAVIDHQSETATRVGASRLWTMVSGIAFAVLFVAGILVGSDTPDYDADDNEWTDWFSDSGNRWTQIVGMILLVLSAVALVVFIATLVRMLRARPTTASIDAAQIAYGTGLILAASTAFGAVALAQMSAAIEIGDIPVPAPDLLRTAEQLGFGLILVVGGIFAAVMVAAVSFAARGAGVLPNWLVMAGFVAAFILLFSVIFLPMAALPLWAIAVAVTARP